MLTYQKYSDTNYIILSDGTVARLLKPSKKGRCEYINFIIGKRQRTINKQALLKVFSETEGDVIASENVGTKD
jgi:hypothetical protein